MKKIFLTFICVILMTISANAQYKSFQFGLNVSPGINITKLNSDFLDNGLNKASFNWGFNGNFYFVENYGISTGFNIKNINGGYSYNDSINGNIKCSISNQYLEIPISMTMRTEKIGKTRIIGNIGYGIGFCLSHNEEHKNIDNITIKEQPEFSKIRNSLIIKLGIEYNIYKSSCITAAFVFNNNFTNIYKKDNPLEHNVMLNTLCIELGFIF
ncbi:MAG: outer membrane beta-barrel protein [Bacteroidales bacterium]|nr:outer membrane beta-barrel protein [Bacteroidales bacterium]